MASSHATRFTLPDDIDSNMLGPFNVVEGNDAIVSTPTFADIKDNAATFSSRARRPFAIRRYISEHKPPLGKRRPLSPYVARKRMLAKLLEFEARFDSASTYDEYWEPVGHLTVPYDHAHVLELVAPWMYPYRDDQLPGMMAGARI
ncbi:hypothetical protein J3F83DRAFT_742008 [Trichoderma novae-zelandiae]